MQMIIYQKQKRGMELVFLNISTNNEIKKKMFKFKEEF